MSSPRKFRPNQTIPRREINMGLLNFLFKFLVFVIVCCTQRVCGNAELKALMELKSSLDPERKILNSWTSNGDPCSGSFMGVACNEHLKVSNISLQGKRLSGAISPSVAGLKCLSGLYLHYNYLTGVIPKEISNLTELTDLYLNVNNLSGSIPFQIGNMVRLQVLQLSHNQLTGKIPMQMGLLKRLEVLDVRNNSLSGTVPPALKRLNGGFKYGNNPDLCGAGFVALRACTDLDGMKINQLHPSSSSDIPKAANFESRCNQKPCPKSSKFPQIFIVVAVIMGTIILTSVGFLTFFRYRRRRQKIGSTADASDIPLSADLANDFNRRSPSPLVSLEYSSGWDPFADGRNGIEFSQKYLANFRFNLEEIESATQYFSEVNLLGRSNYSSVYKGILRDGSVVAIRSISFTSCKSDETEFAKGLDITTSLEHENLVKLRGVCCSSGRGECYLVYDFACMGNLSQYLDANDESSRILDWFTRVSVINGIAKGVGYLHSSNANKPAVLHQNLSVQKILIDKQFKPLISDSGLPKLLAEDVIFSTLKFSAAMGFLAPEYINTGRFTEKNDIYAFGVIILLILSGKRKLTNSMRLAVETRSFEDFIDTNLGGKYSESEAAKLVKIALACTDVLPNNRPTMVEVIQELTQLSN